MNEIKTYINSLIPKNLPKKRKALLFDEIESHILDKADFYEEIGYSWKESVKKAIKDFGTDEEVKNGILNEFETLYHERTWWAIPAGIAVFAMNILAFWLDIWVGSADYNSDPDSAGAFMSFCMVFVLLGGIIFARINNYRKMLIGIGIGSFVSAANFLWCFFPQAAFFAISLNTVYLIDKYTPISMSYFFEYGMISYFLSSIVLLAICSLYCFVTAYRIKSGKAKKIKNANIKTVVFTAVFFAVALSSSTILPRAERYEESYPQWFNEWHSYISDETNYIYFETNLNDNYDEVTARLTEYGWESIEGYKKTLDKLTLKQFNAELKYLDFDENDEVWFVPGNRIRGQYIEGNAFVALQKNESGLICKKAIGNINKSMFYDDSFGYSDGDRKDDMETMLAEFASLRKGDREAVVLNKFGNIFGQTYTKSMWQENGSVKTYYRIYCYGLTDPEAKPYYDRYSSRYIELSFTDGYLSEGKMWWTDNATGDVLTQGIEN